MLLSLAKFPTQLHCTTQLSRNLSKLQLKFSAGVSFRVVHCRTRGEFRVRAKENGDFSPSESDDFDFDDYGGGDDDDDVIVPMENMNKWLESKPRGFGEGKVYDTSIEDKLMEEIEQSKRAQIANVNKLKNGYVKQSVEKEKIKQHSKESEEIMEGFRVRLANLPKKKNIHRDLRVAFEGVKGIGIIVPIVSGNEKTRDPVCRGLAFVDFKNQDDAHRFVQKFSDTYISFGKVQKRIKCEVVVNAKAIDQLGRPEDSNPTMELVEDLDVSKDMDRVFETEVLLSDSISEDSTSNELDDDDENKNDGVEESDAELSKEVMKTKARKKNKIRKLDIPGSAKRLKIKEKAMLANVFSKYRGDSDLKVAETK